MRRLGSTVARLTAMRQASMKAMSAMSADSGSTRLDPLTDFGANPGKLDALCYVPHHLPAGAPLVVVLHGCTQNAALYDRGSGWSELADRHGFALLYPEQNRSNNANLCFNWFAAADARRGRGEAASIAQMVRHMVARHGLDPAQVHINGLSAGGAMTSVMLACYPDLFAGGAVIAGLPFAVAEGLSEALEAMRGNTLPSRPVLGRRVNAAADHQGRWPTLSVWHGTADSIVDKANAGAIVDQWRDRVGLSDVPGSTDTVDGQRRTVWRDASGRVMIERYDIAGMGHGTPIAPRGADGCGQSAPHMLDVGICSTRRLADSWGLTTTRVARQAPATPASATQRIATPESAIAIPLRPTPAASPNGVAKVIDDALRAAGLVR